MTLLARALMENQIAFGNFARWRHVHRDRIGEGRLPEWRDASRPDGTDTLWLRSLDALAARRLVGTEGALQPFWSPDSQSVAFFADGRLKKIATPSGRVQTICRAARSRSLEQPRQHP
jgi:hypothetical protein